MIERWLLAAVVVATASSAGAEPRPVTVAEARAAAATAPEVTAAHARTVAAVAEADAGGAWPATTLSVGTARVSSRLVAIASVPLPIFGVERAERRVRRAEAEVTRADEQVGSGALRQQATIAWLGLYRADQAARTAIATADRLDGLVAMTRARRDAGDAADADVINVETQAARGRIDADDASAAIAVAAAELAAVVGWDPDAELTAAGPLPGDALPAPSAADLERHPEIASQRARIAAAEAAITQARVAGRPVLHADVEVDAFDPGAAATDVLVSLAVDLPIGGRTRQRVAAARAHAAAERAATAVVRGRLAATLTATQRRWTAARTRATALATTLVPAQLRVTELVRAAYQAGEVDLAAVIQAERDLLDVRSQAIDAAIGAAEAWVVLERAAGGAP